MVIRHMIVGIASMPISVTAISHIMASAHSSPPAPLLFLLERLAHIRCFCLTLHADEHESDKIEQVDVTATPFRVSLRCHFMVASPRTMQLDVGEQLDCGAPLTCSVTDGFAYIQLPLAPEVGASNNCNSAARLPGAKSRTTILWGEAGTNRWGTPVPCAPKLSTAELSLSAVSGRASDQLREEVGMFHRAAAQRRRERLALASASLFCASCTPPVGSHPNTDALASVAGASFLRDESVADDDVLSDLIEMGKSHTPFPRAISRAISRAEGGDDSIMGSSAQPPPAQPSLAQPPPAQPPSAQPPSLQPLDVSDGNARLVASPCYLGRHLVHLRALPPPPHVAICSLIEAFACPGQGVWAPMRCAHCGHTLGAAQTEATTDGGDDVEGVRGGAQSVLRPMPLWFDACAGSLLGCTLQLDKSAICTRTLSDGGVAVADAFEGYSIGTHVASCILRAAEAAETARRFALVGSRAPRHPALAVASSNDGGGSGEGAGGEGTEALIMLLSPYVTMATNQPAGGCSGGASDAGVATDAIKVMYTTDSTVMATLGVPVGPMAAAGMTAPAAVRSLVLPDVDHRKAVIQALERSSAMLPPSARRVGALRVGYLPVAPSWD